MTARKAGDVHVLTVPSCTRHANVEAPAKSAVGRTPRAVRLPFDAESLSGALDRLLSSVRSKTLDAFRPTTGGGAGGLSR